MRVLLALLLQATSLAAQPAWDQLVKQYVNSNALVDYTRWKQNDLVTLDGFLAQMAKSSRANAEKATLINAYNALVVRWVLENYPVDSIWATPHPFKEARHVVNGEKVSLDDIEGKLRKMGDPRIHASLVCAARSCPPLRREAYEQSRLDQQLDDNFRTWLANGNLNQFDAATKTARVSEIFKWYAGDFGSVEKYLGRFAPHPIVVEHLEYITYRWGLNDASGRGEDYGQLRFYWDHQKNQ